MEEDTTVVHDFIHANTTYFSDPIRSKHRVTRVANTQKKRAKRKQARQSRRSKR